MTIVTPKPAPRPKLNPSGPIIGGMPIYTRAQFNLVKPGGDYGKYVQYVSARRQATPATYGSLLSQVQPSIESPAQLQARQNQMVNAQIAAQQKLATQTAATQAQQALRARQSQEQAGLAAADMNRSLFADVGGEYNRAAQELANMTTGAVGGAAAQTGQDVAGTNAALQALGLPGVDTTGKLAGPSQAAVESYRSGLGAQNLVNQGESAKFGLAGLVSAQDLRATQEAAAQYAQAQQNIRDTQNQAMQQIIAGRPKLAADTLAQLQDANRQQTALAQSLLASKLAAQQQGFTQKTTTQQLKTQQQQFNRKLKQDQRQFMANLRAKNAQAATLDPSKSRLLGFAVDHNGVAIKTADGKLYILPGFKQNADGTIVKVGVGGKKAGAATAGEVQSFLKSLTHQNYQSTTKRDGTTSTTTRTPSDKTFAMEYPQAYQRLLTMGVDDKTARRYLAGIYKRGEHGRSWLTNEEQTILQQAAARDTSQAGIQRKDLLEVNIDPASGGRFLSPLQYRLFKSKNRLPPGAWGNLPNGTQNGDPTQKRWYIGEG